MDYSTLSDETLRMAAMLERSLIDKAKRFGDENGRKAAQERLKQIEAELKKRQENK